MTDLEVHRGDQRVRRRIAQHAVHLHEDFLGAAASVPVRTEVAL